MHLTGCKVGHFRRATQRARKDIIITRQNVGRCVIYLTTASNGGARYSQSALGGRGRGRGRGAEEIGGGRRSVSDG